MGRYWVQFYLPELANRGLTDSQQLSHPQGPFREAEEARQWAERACRVNDCQFYRIYTHKNGRVVLA